jgi:protein phosphatase 2C
MLITRSLTDQGKRPHMEDRWSVLRSRVARGWTVLCVADGHNGDEVAEHVVHALPRALDVLTTYDATRAAEPCAIATLDTYLSVDAEIAERFDAHVGATVCTVCIGPDARTIVAANCGDTMALLGTGDGAVHLMSAEHKASSEIVAIEARGGRVYAPDGMPRVNGTLNLSRAMGDHYLKRYITCSPYVSRFDAAVAGIAPRYVFIATDGVWDVMDKDDVHYHVAMAAVEHDVDLRSDLVAQPRASLERAADAALAAVLAECRSRRSGDNIAMVMCLLGAPPTIL